MEMLGFIGFGVVLMMVAWLLDAQVKNAQQEDRSYSGANSPDAGDVW
jgi:hypothetical protein